MSQILLIDDDFNLLQMVKLMLERVGHTVEIAKDGEKGIVLAAQIRPDLAIIDVMMPGLSGYDVVRRLRQDPLTASIPIIILTARSQPMDKEMALEAGANAFLSKPVTAQELTERVDAVIKAGVNYRVHTGLLTEPVPRPGISAPTTSSKPITGRVPPAGPPQATPPAPAAGSVTPRPGSAPARGRRPIGADTAQNAAAAPETAERTPIGADALGRAPIGADVAGRAPIGADSTARTPIGAPLRLPLIAVTSLRGGTGCTTIAINMAVALAQSGQKVCLAELSTAGAHIPLYLHLKPVQTWADLPALHPDPGATSALLEQHPPTGISILAAPPRPVESGPTSDLAQGMLAELGGAFNPVVVDIRLLDAASRVALQAAAAVVVVMTDDPPSIQSSTHLLAALEELGIDAGRIRVVLNHVRPTFDVPSETIQKALKRPISLETPYDPGQVTAIRRGQPLVAAKPDSAFAKGIQQLIRAFTL